MPRLSDRSFPRSVRILRKVEFGRVVREGVRVSDGAMQLRAIPRPGGEALPARLGITVGRKAGKAVVRNLIRRRIREAFRVHRSEIPAGLDLVVFPAMQRGDEIPAYRRIEASLVSLAGEARRRLDLRARRGGPDAPGRRGGAPRRP